MASFEVSEKYPSTEHLPFSPGLGEGDTILSVGTASSLFCDGRTEVVLTEKLDGGNCCIARGLVYARTHKHEARHPWFGTIKQMHALLSATLEDPTLELFGENMTAAHSISYAGLTSYFYLFGVRRGGVWLSHDDVQGTAELLGVPTPPLRYRGPIPNIADFQSLIERLMAQPSAVAGVGNNGAGGGGGCLDLVRPEGFVVRIAGAFDASAFSRSIAKYVRAGHVQTGDDFTRLWPHNKARLVGLGSPPPLLEELFLSNPDAFVVEHAVEAQTKIETKLAGAAKIFKAAGVENQIAASKETRAASPEQGKRPKKKEMAMISDESVF
mmetsp:Transcript_12163/g.22513  ORF Transcript_12163/g.22513 Transcript_12163/m.22513 type:complete len:326 (-) Transcript_12163:133-1110(-)